MTPEQFISKWAKIKIRESQAAQTHFNDVCALVGHPELEMVCFEALGQVDVYFADRFIWEYKGPHADLDAAYRQLLLYREALGNPPLLITSDTQKIIIHTNYTNTPKQVYEITFERLTQDGLELLKRVFHDPIPLEFFRPTRTKQEITQATANDFVAVTGILEQWARAEGQAMPPERLAQFTTRLLFCLFADSLGLLPDTIFSQLVAHPYPNSQKFTAVLRNLFITMRDGGLYGFRTIPHFNGGLFDDDFVPANLPQEITQALLKACQQDWSAIDPSIFGTLFERVIDENKRAQLGAHYTSFDDIMLIIEPVLMQPYREQWAEVQREVRRLLRQNPADNATAETQLQQFSHEVASIKVLDPACGSGNFLYVALQQLLTLQKEVIAFAKRYQLPDISLSVSPAQLYGLEKDLHAHELAQITAWIGYIQWRFENGFEQFDEPILRPLHNIQRMDAILSYNADGQPIEPTWPTADIIIGNPPFLGGNRIRQELGHEYVTALFELYKNRLPAFSDLVCYWFERARQEMVTGQVKRAGLLATNSIRGGVNRAVLERIKQMGDIFMAWSDRPWLLEGATVRISVVGFDKGVETRRVLDGTPVTFINADLSNGKIDLTVAKILPENVNLCFYGSQQKGLFSITTAQAQKLFAQQTADEPDYHEVIKRALNGQQLLHREEAWVIDFGTDMPEETAQKYRAPYEYVKQVVYPERATRRETRQKSHWWLHARPSPRYRRVLATQERYIASIATAKYRLFVWLNNNILADHSLIVYARDDDYFWGVLSSKLHDMWALRLGTSLGATPRYTPSTTFETFPFPWSPGHEPTADPHYQAIAQAAHALDQFRQKWLNPDGVGITISEKQLQKRTLTNLYNALEDYRQSKAALFLKWGDGFITLTEMEELHDLHTELDQAVLAAYGWPTNLNEEQILARLLALNEIASQRSALTS